MTTISPARLAAGALLATAAAAAQAVTHIEVTGHYDNRVGTSDAASQGVVGSTLLKTRPAQRPGEVLEFVPGVIVTQHSGDGKANQYFLRGFNLDHGTDFATRVAGVPVNMPTHGHGQGYSDLNFLIPELVQRIEYRKGPYFAASGDFSSAGSADISYQRRFDAPFAQLTLGEGSLKRLVAGASQASAGIGSPVWMGAVELQRNDGPWTVPERLRKANVVLGASAGNRDNGWGLTLMDYHARWTATDQVPERALLDGRLGRFDNVDPTTGGDTARSSLSAEWHASSGLGKTQINAWLLRYRLDLNSNFTYALDRPGPNDEANDQFKQTDRRRAFGVDGSQRWEHELLGLAARSEVGASLRHDRIRVGLHDSVARQITNTVREDRVRESLLGVYGQSAVSFMPMLRGVFGLRVDHLRATVQAQTQPLNSGRASDSQISPRLALVAGPWAQTELFFNLGRGLHSNDARGTTTRVDPRSGDAVERVPVLVASTGSEVGLRTEALKGLQLSLALWQLRSDGELVYIGDAGNTEAGPASRRSGLEWNNRWTPLPWLLVDADFAWSRARFANGDRIPNAVERVASMAVSVKDLGPWSASLQGRYLGPGALLEDNSQRSRSSFTTNLRLGLKPARGHELTLDVFNLANRQVDDIQYFYESRLPGEAEAVEDRHLHPAEPRTVRVSWRVEF